MQKMLRALDHRRPVRLLGDIDQAFHPQKIRPEILFQRVEQKLQRVARGRLVADEGERGDVAVVMMVVVVIVIVVVIVVVIVMLVGGKVQPVLRRRVACGRVEAGAAQERGSTSSAGSSIRLILAAGLIRRSRAVSAASAAARSAGAIRSSLVIRM